MAFGHFSVSQFYSSHIKPASSFLGGLNHQCPSEAIAARRHRKNNRLNDKENSRGCKPKPAEFVHFAKRVDPAVESHPHLPSWKERPLPTCPVFAAVRLAFMSGNICFTTRYVQLPNCLKMASRNVRKTLSQTDHVRKPRLYGFATPFVSVYFRTNMHSTLSVDCFRYRPERHVPRFQDRPRGR